MSRVGNPGVVLLCGSADLNDALDTPEPKRECKRRYFALLE